MTLCRWQTSLGAVARVVMIGLLAAPAAAQTPAADDHEAIARLLKRVDELERHIQELEGRMAGANAPAPAPSAPAPPPAAPVEPAAEPATQAEPAPAVDAMPEMQTGIGTRMQIHGFADTDFVKSSTAPATFSLGQLDLFMNSRLSDKLSMVGEVVFEADANNAYGVDVERLLLTYAPSDLFNVSVGRYHTAIGYYNTTYHHGTWFQTAVGRPFVFGFEDAGGPLPVHGVGVTATGVIPSGRLGLRYVAEVSNGRAARNLDEPVQNVHDENSGKAVNVALLARPDWLPGLQAGVSVYRDRLTPNALPAFDETIMAGHVVFQNSLFEQLNEAIFIRHTAAGASTTLTTTSFYSQISRQFGRVRPYARYEYFDAPQGDPFVGTIGRRTEPSAGVRYELGSLAALKLQYNRLRRSGLTDANGMTIQLAFTF